MKAMGLLAIYAVLIVVGSGVSMAASIAMAEYSPGIAQIVLIGGLLLSMIVACWPAVWLSYKISPETDEERAFQANATKVARSMRLQGEK
jgi:hypothetical protein